jgi:sister-chromatid-cohesion protein PDS5
MQLTPAQDIFNLFVTSILPALSDPSHAYNAQHKYVLVSLAEVKSIVLLTDLPNADSLMIHLFSNFFDTISGSTKASTGESIAKDVEYHMTQMLVTLVDESQSLPTDVIDVIVAQFLRAASPPTGKGKQELEENQSTLLMKELPEAYNMAKTICNACPEKMARYISQYFNDVIMDVSGAAPKSNGHRRTSDAAADSDDEEAHVGPTESDLNELKKAHRLLRELWRASPSVLQNAIPQLEAELSAENVQLRLLATETLGDIISGIGSAGPPPPPIMDPAAYPPVKLENYPQSPVSNSILTTPISPQSFAQTHPGVYNNFIGRKNDKSPVIRAGWTTAVGRILVTSAGGIGLSSQEEISLVKGLGEKLNDADDKVRLAAVKAIGGFGFRDIMTKLAPNGGVSKTGSVLCSLADRARDRRHAVRVEGMITLARMWGVAAGEILAGNQAVTDALGPIPTKVFDAYYANDVELNVLLDHVMFEQLIPLSYPPSKSKKSKAANGDSQAQTPQANGDVPFDPDKIRTERILLLVKSLDPKSKKAFFAMQARQKQYSTVLEKFLQLCEEYNGGVTEKDPKEVKNKLDRLIKWFVDFLPDALRTTQDLAKYAKLHDRRSYQLLRFAMAPESDFNTVHNAIKEFQKRIQNAPGAPAGILDTLVPIIYRSSCLVYNRSHQPVILQYTRSDENELGSTARMVTREISENFPTIFEASVKELCKSLSEQAPSDTKPNEAGSVDTLKALASFAREHKDKIPQDRKFIQTLISFAMYGTPAKVAKYAVNVLAATNRKEMHLKDLLDKSLENWEYGKDHFLTKLAAIAQIYLIAPKLLTEEASEEILAITTRQLILQARTPKSDDDPSWQLDAEVDEECEAKCWAIKILVNKLRSCAEPEKAKKMSTPIFKTLNTLVFREGEISKKNDTPNHHRSRLRLLAAQQILKLCQNKIFDEVLTPVDFNRLAVVSQAPLANIRRGFVEKLQKYLVKVLIPARFYTIIFLTAFEPDLDFRTSIMTWIRSRLKVFHDGKHQTFESVFPRLLHLLAHHPDFTTDPEELLDQSRYVMYYITTVATEEYLPLIYKYTERLKGLRDALPGADSDNLYIMADMAQALVKKWEEKKGWSMQTWPSKVGMPLGLFSPLPNHEVAQKIAETNFLPEEMDGLLDDLVRNAERKKVCPLTIFPLRDVANLPLQPIKPKRRLTHDNEDSPHPSKKQKSEHKPQPSKTPAVKKERPVKEKKTPKPKKEKEPWSTPAPSSADRRKSGRTTASAKRTTYAERDDSDDDKEMWAGVAEWVELSGSEAEREARALKGATASPEVESEPEVATPEPEPEEEEVEPTPPRSNGKKALKPNPKKATPKPLASNSRVTKTKPKPKSPIVKASPRVKAKAKEPIKVAAVKGKDKGKGKAKPKVKDIFDMDDSD